MGWFSKKTEPQPEKPAETPKPRPKPERIVNVEAVRRFLEND